MDEIFTPVTLFKKSFHLEDYAFRMENWFRGKRFGPLRIDAELHRRCNLNCRMCARRASSIDLTAESKKIEMPTERWVELARESAKLGTKVWNISGLGEPMCKPETLFPVMEMLKACEIFGEITTNGTLWKEEDIKRAVEMEWDSVCVSIDAPDARTHDYIRRVKGAFRKATQTIRLFRKYRDRVGYEVPCITINVVLNKLNYTKLPAMIKLAKKLGADAIFVEPMIVYTSLGEEMRMRDEDIVKLVPIAQKAQELAKEYNISLTLSCINPQKQFESKLIEKTSNIREILLQEAKRYSDKILSIPCYYPWFFLMVRTDGTAIHCGECKEVQDNLRNKSLKEVWFGRILESIREDFVDGKLPSYCNFCRPNVIEDMREIRRAITMYRDETFMRKHILDLLKENMKLKKEIFRLRKGKLAQKQLEELNTLVKYKRELIQFKRSLSYRIGKKIGNSIFGKIVKRAFGVYV